MGGSHLRGRGTFTRSAETRPIFFSRCVVASLCRCRHAMLAQSKLQRHQARLSRPMLWKSNQVVDCRLANCPRSSHRRCVDSQLGRYVRAEEDSIVGITAHSPTREHAAHGLEEHSKGTEPIGPTASPSARIPSATGNAMRLSTEDHRQQPLQPSAASTSCRRVIPQVHRALSHRCHESTNFTSHSES